MSFPPEKPHIHKPRKGREPKSHLPNGFWWREVALGGGKDGRGVEVTSQGQPRRGYKAWGGGAEPGIHQDTALGQSGLAG